jgi:alpha-1,3-mannosyltransferase
MFNDCIAMTLLFGAVLLLVYKRWLPAAIAYSLALSVKMNILLFYPALIMIQIREVGIRKALKLQAVIIATQFLVAIPFLRTHAWAYLSTAFNFGRHFEWQWTVNWRFVGETTFLKLQSSKFLITGHVLSLLLWALLRTDGIVNFVTILMKGQKHTPMTSTEIARWMFEANLIGILFSRSLHYQFLSWYLPTIPFMLLAGNRAWLTISAAIFTGIEYCWNVYPSTLSSSLLLFILNCSLLVVSMR